MLSPCVRLFALLVIQILGLSQGAGNGFLKVHNASETTKLNIPSGNLSLDSDAVKAADLADLDGEEDDAINNDDIDKTGEVYTESEEKTIPVEDDDVGSGNADSADEVKDDDSESDSEQSEASLKVQGSTSASDSDESDVADDGEGSASAGEDEGASSDNEAEETESLLELQSRDDDADDDDNDEADDEADAKADAHEATQDQEEETDVRSSLIQEGNEDPGDLADAELEKIELGEDLGSDSDQESEPTDVKLEEDAWTERGKMFGMSD